jgi:hypothetical protein
MNTDGSGKRNLTDTGGINDSTPDFGEVKKG